MNWFIIVLPILSMNNMYTKHKPYNVLILKTKKKKKVTI